jgi:hypothetical protein
MYVRDMAGRPSTRRSGSTSEEYDRRVFRTITNEITKQVFPPVW